MSGMQAGGAVLAATITKLPLCDGRVLLTGSHGGAYPGSLALAAGVRAAVFHDAGIGRDEAGVAALAMLEGFGIAAAAVSHLSCRVGDPADALARGRISRANAPARACGVVAGQPCAAALRLLERAPHRRGEPPAHAEHRQVREGERRRLVLIDSAAMVLPADRDAVVVTGSHGGLVGGNPAMALRTEAYAALFNDAGIGIERAGLGRLPALDARGIAALAVDASTARIGEAASTLGGTVSAANDTARARGAAPGMPAAILVESWLRA